jgi:hypothetical protein
MSEELREQFYKAFPKHAGILEMYEAGSIGALDAITARHEFAVWKACAKIKEAELHKIMHYPECWDTAAYPTVLDAVTEVFNVVSATHHRQVNSILIGQCLRLVVRVVKRKMLRLQI